MLPKWQRSLIAFVLASTKEQCIRSQANIPLRSESAMRCAFILLDKTMNICVTPDIALPPYTIMVFN